MTLHPLLPPPPPPLRAQMTMRSSRWSTWGTRTRLSLPMPRTWSRPFGRLGEDAGGEGWLRKPDPESRETARAPSARRRRRARCSRPGSRRLRRGHAGERGHRRCGRPTTTTTDRSWSPDHDRSGSGHDRDDHRSGDAPADTTATDPPPTTDPPVTDPPATTRRPRRPAARDRPARSDHRAGAREPAAGRSGRDDGTRSAEYACGARRAPGRTGHASSTGRAGRCR